MARDRDCRSRTGHSGTPTVPRHRDQPGQRLHTRQKRAFRRFRAIPGIAISAARAHLMYLVEFRSRVMVLMHWSFQYLTFGRGARLISGEPHQDPLREDGPETEAV